MDYVFILGERFDTLGLHPLDKASAFGEHVRKLVALRKRVHDIVYQGRLRDTLGLSGMPPQVEARVFVSQKPAGVVVNVWDRRKDRQPWELQLDPAGWPGAMGTCRLLKLDGSTVALKPTQRDGKLVVMVPGEEILALRFDP